MAPLCTEDDFYAASTKHLEKNHEEICQSENRDGEIKIHVDHRAATADCRLVLTAPITTLKTESR